MSTENGSNRDFGSSHCYRAYGFEPCEYEPDECERCKQVKPLYFGDRDYWDSREGSHLCGDCLDEQIAADKEYTAYMEEMIESQRDHEASHMPWMM
ncbi:hypothetical protein [Rubripirellula reticaptiva]|uniref:Uncharacterized protein n=1 Tax=Rubripirellula reticaptiva TaxID=2528013 RepID=A0A5C6ERH4_9BACT|nr:hypothetical protein [Rubripirellula reticaptiva]TWU51538.1 hypothetical protein Poly59_31300 [Rubripirellula reticaptiva]